MAFEFAGRTIATDAEGYLEHRADWSPELRDALAQSMGLSLTAEHLTVIATVQRYYDEYETTPPMRGLIKLLRQEGHAELADSVKLAVLFPDGAAKSAAKLAGLPKPVKCI